MPRLWRGRDRTEDANAEAGTLGGPWPDIDPSSWRTISPRRSLSANQLAHHLKDRLMFGDAELGVVEIVVLAMIVIGVWLQLLQE